MSVIKQLRSLKARNKPPIIYHTFNISNAHASLNVQIKPHWNRFMPEAMLAAMPMFRHILLVKHGRMPTWKDCEYLKAVGLIKAKDGKQLHFSNLMDMFHHAIFVSISRGIL